MKSQNCHKLTVSSHWDQEMFNITVMSYRNSSVYVQRMIDCILWSHCDFFRVYINNIIIYTKMKSLDDHLIYLNKVFSSLAEKKIYPFSKKSFSNYLTVQLLNQCIDALKLITAEDKLTAIVNIEFLCTLFTLKKYLDMTDYLHQYIFYYTVIIRSLQKRKTQLNHDLQKLWVEKRPNNEKISNIEDNICKLITDRISIEKFITAELNSFHQLQSLFFRSIILIHYNLKCQLYTDINTSKEFSFRAHIYHMKENHSFIRALSESFITTAEQKSLKSILFFSKALFNTETHYWLTELEVADLVWLIQKIYYMLESAEKLIIIYTDHSITLSKVHQLSLISITSIDKMNLQLICISEHL